MKVIFLDHDGVCCLAHQWGGRYKRETKWKRTHDEELDNMPLDCRFDKFDPKSVLLINSIVDATGAEIVVSSDWKLHCNLEEMKQLYINNSMLKTPIDFTPNMKEYDLNGASLYHYKRWYEQMRADEIHTWLKQHPEVTHWVAIDDLDMAKHDDPNMACYSWGLSNFVHVTNMNEGIKKSGIKEKILEFLV